MQNLECRQNINIQILYETYTLYVKIKNMVTVQNLKVASDRFNVVGISSSVNYV
jgi:hypothetical protein